MQISKLISNLSQNLLKIEVQKAIIHIVPNINPDGSVLGHLRTNALGANLNREWQNPSAHYAPEVKAVLDHMCTTGCDAFIDVHGDEEVTFVFLDGDEGIRSFGPGISKLQDIFRNSLVNNTSPDFQATDFYGITKPGQAEMGIAANAVGERFRCLSVTLEMPFKDAARHPDILHGWTAERSMQYGQNCIVPLLEVVSHIVNDDIEPSGPEKKRKKKAG